MNDNFLVEIDEEGELDSFRFVSFNLTFLLLGGRDDDGRKGKGKGCSGKRERM